MKALKTGFVVIFAVIFSIACSTTNEPANRNATPATNSNASNAGQGVVVTNSNQSASSSGESKGGEMKPTASADTVKVYNEKCAMCHGEDGKGVTKGAADFTNAAWQKKETDAEFAEMIKKGKKPMPAFGDKLSEEQINALVQYIRAFAKK
jgi:mono/diheme cytochrome c family protein